MPRLSALALLLAACTPTFGATPTPEGLAAAGDGRAWLVGNNGYAAFHDGGTLVRLDYPRARGADRYELGVLPAAHVVGGGVPVLLLRTGEVLRGRARSAERGAWEPLAPLFTEEDQVDQVAVRGDEVVVATNRRRVLTLSAASLRRGSVAPSSSAAPTYFTWLGFLGEDLYGTGWDAGGNVPAVWRRGSAGWVVAARWPGRRASSGLRGVFRTADAFYALTGDELWPIDEARPDVELAPRRAEDLGLGTLCYVRGRTDGTVWVETCLRNRIFEPQEGASYPIPDRGGGDDALARAFVGVTRGAAGFRAFYRDGHAVPLHPEGVARVRRPIGVAVEPR